MIKAERIRQQSEAAIKQWGPQWSEHCVKHFSFKKKPMADFENIGIGRAVLCVANGYSFEENIETIKKYKDNVDILACDKTMGHLLEHGIVPTYVIVCDANVDYKKYMEKWKDKLSNTTLFINACANPEWSHNGNWKDIVFFLNIDVLNSQDKFSKLSGVTNFIAAGTNVSNAMVILLTQCDNTLRKNFFGYDKILLIGYDYSWKAGGKYYAFDEDGGGKVHYMQHSYVVTPSGEFAYSSGNLAFSLEWLLDYVTAFKLPVVQCGKDAILQIGGNARDLAEQMQYKHKPQDGENVRGIVNEIRRLDARMKQLMEFTNQIGRDHYWSYVRSI